MPTLVPSEQETVYLVLEDFGKLGRIWREIDEADANEAAVIAGILAGEYENPARVVAFNTGGNWARDVTEQIAAKLADAARDDDCELGPCALAFVERALREVASNS
jgi:hypothetical protein